MKLLFIFLFPLSCFAQKFIATKTKLPISIIVISGESNAGGFAQNSDLSTEEKSVRPEMQIFNNTTMTFQNLHIGVNNLLGHVGINDSLTQHGFECGIANYTKTGYVWGPLYILKSGFGGAIIKYYNDSADVSYQGSGKNPWQLLKQRLDSAKKIVTTLNGGIAPKIYLLWTQGINDSNQGTNSNAWKDSTKSFFTKFRLRYGQVPIFTTLLMTPFTAYSAKISEYCTEVTDCFPVSAESAPVQVGSVTHWSAAGNKIMAYNFLNLLRSKYILN